VSIPLHGIPTVNVDFGMEIIAPVVVIGNPKRDNKCEELVIAICCNLTVRSETNGKGIINTRKHSGKINVLTPVLPKK
jgi:hypothetical protein